MPYYIAFDVAHKPRGKIDENYSELRDFLNSNDFVCYNYLEATITQETLKPYDILVFTCPDYSKISSQEITEIESWVKQDGGGLLLLSHAGGDRGRSSNLSELSQQFGIAFESDQVLDETVNLGMENLPVISNFMPPHPITKNLGEICYRAGCSLTILGSAFSIAISNESSDPFSCPLICVAEPENGRVCATGSYEMFRNNVGGGFSNEEHPELASNIFKWLVSDYRTEMRSTTVISAPVAPAGTDSSTGQAAAGGSSVDIDFTIKISNKSELVELLQIFSNQINTIKNTIDNLIQKASASEDEIINLKKIQEAQAAAAVAQATFQAAPTTSQEGGTPPQPLGEDYKDLYELKPAPLSALPPKPASLVEKDKDIPPPVDADFIGLPSVDDAPTEEPEPEVKKPKAKKAPKAKEKKKPKVDKEEILAEKEGLESKLNSIHNLLSFIEKKHESGKMDDKSYEKQTKRAKNDIDKTAIRLEEIGKILESL
jgi:hypothetical protein